MTTQTSACGEVSANSIWFASALKDNHKLNPPSRKRLMNGINNDATLYIEAYGFTACFLHVCVPHACEPREGGKRPFLIKKSIPVLCEPTLLPSCLDGGKKITQKQSNKNILFGSKWHCVHFNCSEISAVRRHP